MPSGDNLKMGGAQFEPHAYTILTYVKEGERMNNWSDLEKWLSTTNFEKSMEAFRDIPIVEQFFNSMKHTSRTTEDKTAPKNYRFKDGKEHLDVLYELPVHARVEDIKLFIREDYIRLEGLPEETIEMIKLPKLVKAKYCRARLVDGELQIRLTKRPRSRKFYEHSIQN